MRRLPPALIAGVAAVVLALLLWGVHQFKEHIRQDALVKERTAILVKARARQDSVIRAKDDSLVAARLHSDTAVRTIYVAAADYKKRREKVDTSRAAQPVGTPIGMTVVANTFIKAADSLAVLVPTLTEALRTERLFSTRRIEAGDSANKILLAENAQLRIAARLNKPSGIRTVLTQACIASAAYGVGSRDWHFVAGGAGACLVGRAFH